MPKPTTKKKPNLKFLHWVRPLICILFICLLSYLESNTAGIEVSLNTAKLAVFVPMSIVPRITTILLCIFLAKGSAAL